MTDIWADILAEKLKGYNRQDMILKVHPSQVNFVWGSAGKNKRFFEQKDLRVKLLTDDHLGKYEVQVGSC